MKQSIRCWLPCSSTSLGVLALLMLLSLAWTSVAFGVTIVKPKPQASLSGITQIWAVASPEEKCAYAVLCVDAQGRSVTNMQPIRFDLDTTKFKNGEHQIVINLADLGGSLDSSRPITVIFANPSNGDFHLPSSPHRPMLSTKTAAPKTVATKPAATKPTTVAAVKKPSTTKTPSLETPVVKPETPVVALQPTRVVFGPYTPQPPLAARVQPVDVKIAHALVEPFQEEKTIARDSFPCPRPARRGPITVVLDGKPMLFSVTPIMDHGNLLVLLRPLVAAANGTIDWDDAKQRVYACVRQHQMTFTPGEKIVKVDGQDVTIERPVIVADGHTTVPVSVWHDLFGGSVSYDHDFGCVCLQSVEAEEHASLPR